MLELLRIRNLALIEDLELEFSQGLNVITGESGAGKSFILKALDFVLGEKISPEMIRPGHERAQVEALFGLPEGETIIRREILGDTGRSRLYMNDALSSQEKVKELRPRLMVHTSQHGQQRLLRPSYHTKILDAHLPEELLRKKDELMASLRRIQDEKSHLEAKASELEQKREFLEYQAKEIQKVGPKPGEEEELEERKETLRSQAKAQESVQRCLDLLSGPEGQVLDKIHELQRQISYLAGIEETFRETATQMEDFRQLLLELDRGLRARPLAAESEQELESIEARLWELSRLKRKLNRPLEGIVRLQGEISENLDWLDDCQLQLQQLERRERSCKEELAGILEQVNAKRQEAGKELARKLEHELQSLGFPEDVSVVFELSSWPLVDDLEEQRARLMWVPNPGQSPQPLDQIASGGELSRFLLALVGLMAREELPTLLFDEVDSGIGGVTLGQLGEKIRQLSSRQQVILISHWPQLACLADRHFQVAKQVENSQTYSRCTLLGREEIFDELARMAGGGEQGKLLARKLMNTRG